MVILIHKENIRVTEIIEIYRGPLDLQSSQ